MDLTRYSIEEYVRWEDIDAAGIINYQAYLRFFALAEAELLRSAGAPLPLPVRISRDLAAARARRVQLLPAGQARRAPGGRGVLQPDRPHVDPARFRGSAQDRSARDRRDRTL